jgi:hypothetical protein
MSRFPIFPPSEPAGADLPRRLAELQAPEPDPALAERLLIIPTREPMRPTQRRLRLRPWARCRVVFAVASTALAMAFIWQAGTPQPAGAEIAAAVERAETWHLSGWRQVGNQQVPWEVWGRRTPFLYREQNGTEVLFQGEAQRLHLLPSTAGGPGMLLRLPPDATSDPVRWSRLTVGTDWGQAEPWRVEEGVAIFRWSDHGMHGPGSSAHDYYFVDPRTWLPFRREYRLETPEGEKVLERLTITYGLPVPDEVAIAPRLEGALEIDAAAALSDPPGENTATEGALSATLTPLKLDRHGNVLAALACRLGGLPLDGTQDRNLAFLISNASWSMAGHAPRPISITDDRGRPYVRVSDLRTGDVGDMVQGRMLLWLAPLEPLAPEEPLPLRLRLTQNLHIQGQQLDSVLMLARDLSWNVSLPAVPETITPVDFEVPKNERRVFYHEAVPLAARVAAARSQAYFGTDPDNAVRWLKHAIALSAPDSDNAQFLRGQLAHQYRQAREGQKAQQVLLEILAVKERYPHTWGYYATSARSELARLRKDDW